MKLTKLGREGREAVRKGINFSEEIIRSTLGPNGKNVLIGRLGVNPLMTNDGATVAMEIEREDEFENEGCNVIKELTQLASIRIKGATTTATILYRAILDEAFKRIDEKSSIIEDKINVINIKKDIKKWCDEVCKKIEEKSRPITLEEVYNVALTAGEYEWIATMCRDVLSQIGVNGSIKITDGTKTEVYIYKGMEINSGYSSYSDKFINTDDRKCILESPKILIFNEPISDYNSILKESSNNNLIIITPDYPKSFIPLFEDVKLKNKINIVMLKLPTYGKLDIYRDIETLIGESGIIDRAIISESSTYFLGGKGNTDKRVEEIRRLKSDSESALDNERYEQRIANLTGGIAIIKIGAESEFERIYYKKKMEDAINAAQKGLAKGVVNGGGVCLKEISEELENNILTNPLKVPYTTIQESFGEPTEVSKLVIDSTQITIEVIKLVCSMASTFITGGTAIVPKREKENDIS